MQAASRHVFRLGTAVLAILLAGVSGPVHADDAGKNREIRPVADQVRQTEVSICGDMFLINGRPTYEGREYGGMKIEG